MRAIGLTEFGGPEVLQAIDLPEPHPATGEVRIRVHAAAVNPTDLLFRAGRGVQASLLNGRPGPYIPGMEAAGIIDELGPDTASRLKVGDVVVALTLPASPHRGAYAEQIVVPAASVVHAPANGDFPAASTLLLNALTAWLTLDALALDAGQTLVVTGAPGAYGGYVLQLARAAGLRVIADASPSDQALVRSLGADEVILRGEYFAERVRTLIPEGVAGLADGAMLNESALPAIFDGGTIVTVRGWDRPTERNIVLHKIAATTAFTNTALLGRLVQLVEDHTVTLRVADILPAERAADAHRRLAAGGVRGRLVLDFTI